MYGIITALLITVFMMLFIILKANSSGVRIFYCKKSDLEDLLKDIPDDCVIQILIGGNSYEHNRDGNSRRRNL